jgi:hypothetical protein
MFYTTCICTYRHPQKHTEMRQKLKTSRKMYLYVCAYILYINIAVVKICMGIKSSIFFQASESILMYNRGCVRKYVYDTEEVTGSQ